MFRALAVSSNVYFYEIGGGYQDQEGLGIFKIEEYLSLFGFGSKTGANVFSEQEGVIPTPEWKAGVFDGEKWRIGDTYNTSIGQYGFQVTPIQVARGIAAIANSGNLLTPKIVLDDEKSEKKVNIDIPEEYFKVIKEGMRMAVTEGTAQGLHLPFVNVAAKTGTAERGVTKKFVNSWITGFFPYENPKYAFVVIMEEAGDPRDAGVEPVVVDALELVKEKKSLTDVYSDEELAANGVVADDFRAQIGFNSLRIKNSVFTRKFVSP